MREIISILHSQDQSNEDKKEKLRRCQLALDMYCYRIAKYIGAYFVSLDGIDAIVFSGGVGENSLEVRRDVTKRLQCLGIYIDDQKNEEVGSKLKSEKLMNISGKRSSIQTFVIQTDEEGEIARITFNVLEQY